MRKRGKKPRHSFAVTITSRMVRTETARWRRFFGMGRTEEISARQERFAPVGQAGSLSGQNAMNSICHEDCCFWTDDQFVVGERSCHHLARAFARANWARPRRHLFRARRAL